MDENGNDYAVAGYTAVVEQLATVDGWRNAYPVARSLAGWTR